jgi:uncharacterized DUF497 family protein
VTFEQAAEAFFDPFLKVVDASRNEEARDAIIGMDTRWHLLFVVHMELEEDAIRLISARKATQRAKRPGRNVTTMKLEQLRKRLDKQRPMTTISMRFPVDVLDDLKRVAPLRGFSGYQPLIRAYVGQGLREDLERLEKDPVTALVESLKRHGVSEEVLQEALAEMVQR